MYPEQFLKSLSVEFTRLAENEEEVNAREWADKINAYLQYLKLQSQLEEQARTLRELEGKFSIQLPKDLLQDTESQAQKPRGRPKKKIEE